MNAFLCIVDNLFFQEVPSSHHDTLINLNSIANDVIQDEHARIIIKANEVGIPSSTNGPVMEDLEY